MSDKKATAAKPKEQKEKKADDKDESKSLALTEQDIAMFKRYGKGPYSEQIRKGEDDMKEFNQKISTLCGIKESDTGLSMPS